MENNSILSPVMLWRDFQIKYPLQESKTSEEIFDNVIYSEIYFSGRETSEGRVRIYGVFAKSRVVKKNVKKAGLLILPDASESVDLETVNYFVKQGYSVLMIDYRGEVAGAENFTRYPDCISYANYFSRGDRMDRCNYSARETCWFEWVSCAKYALNFLKTQRDLDSVGVIGIKSGADVGWQLCSMEEGGVNCFVPLFSAGGSAYKGYYKNDDVDMPMGDERLRYLAGVDAGAYTQYMRCPTFFMIPSNCSYSDVERCFDSLSRVPKDTPLYINIAPRFTDVLDDRCKKNVDLFLAKYLLGFKTDIPAEPKMSVGVSGRKVDIVVEEPDSVDNKVKRVSVFVAEGENDPEFRNYVDVKPVSVEDGRQSFAYNINTTCSYINVFAVVSFRNGFTVSTKIVTRKFPKIRFPKNNLLYSGKLPLTKASVRDFKDKSFCGLFFEEEYPVSLSRGAGDIAGIKGSRELVFCRFSPEVYRINENALLKADVYSEKRCAIKITIITEKRGEINEFSTVVYVRQGGVWNDILVRLSDFKSETNRSIEDYSTVKAIKFASDFTYVLNNVLVL